MTKLEPIKGHIVLYCKGHYSIPKEEKSFFEGLKRIWAIRCGYDYSQTSRDVLSYIAMEMYDILLETQTSEKMEYIMEQLHRNLVPKWKEDFVRTLSPIEAVIWEYRYHISNIQIKEFDEKTKKYYELVKLPKPKKQVFNRILRGNGKYDDYKLITN